MTPIVSDTSPINYLVLIEAVGILPRLFGEVIIPQAVLNELLNPASPPRVRQFVTVPPRWLQIGQAPEPTGGLEHLDAGEIGAIVLAESVGASLLFKVDRAGVTAANGRGLKTLGTIGTLDAAARHGLIDLTVAFGKLERTTFRMPKRICEWLLAGIA